MGVVQPQAKDPRTISTARSQKRKGATPPDGLGVGVWGHLDLSLLGPITAGE